jgi:putative spermidine/putrescine transport system permease protein
LPAVPLLLLIAVALVGPALVLIIGSVTDADGFTLESWVKVLTRRGDQTAILTSLQLAATVATISALVGVPVAWAVSRMLRFSRATWTALLTVGGNFGGIGLGFAYFSVLGTVGMVTLAIQGAGVDFQPPRPSSFAGLVIGYLYTNVPLFVLLTIPAMGAVRDDWWEAAQVASATRSQFWRRVGIPVLAPFILAGWLLIFTWSIGIYGLAYALAGAGAAMTTQLITLRIGDILTTDLTETWRANVLAVILMLLAIVSLLAYRALLRRGLRWFR